VSAATKGTGSSRRTRTESEGKRTGIGQPARRVLTDHGNQRDERCQPGWKEQCGKAKSARLRWMPSGLATRPLSLAYSSKPVHNHPQEPTREEAPARPPSGRSPPRTNPHTPDPRRTPPPPKRPHFVPGTHRRAAAELDVEVGLPPSLSCPAGRSRFGLVAAGTGSRLSRGRGHTNFGSRVFMCGRAAVLSRNSVARFGAIARWLVEAHGRRSLSSDRAGGGGQ